VFVIGNDPGSHVVVSQELASCPRVLGSNQRYLAKNAERPQGDVLQIADWRGHQKKSAQCQNLVNK
jgi:hypothetical protein